MTIRNTLKTVALSLVLIASTSGAFAATTAWIDDDTKIRDEPSKYGDVIGYADEGTKVKITDCDGNYCYALFKYEEDGWVKKSDLSFKQYDEPEIEVCFGGGGYQNGFGFGGSICLN